MNLWMWLLAGKTPKLTPHLPRRKKTSGCDDQLLRSLPLDHGWMMEVVIFHAFFHEKNHETKPTTCCKMCGKNMQNHKKWNLHMASCEDEIQVSVKAAYEASILPRRYEANHPLEVEYGGKWMKMGRIATLLAVAQCWNFFGGFLWTLFV